MNEKSPKPQQSNKNIAKPGETLHNLQGCIACGANVGFSERAGRYLLSRPEDLQECGGTQGLGWPRACLLNASNRR